MRLLIRYLNGNGQDAILLATKENRIRVAVPGRDDAMEFRFVEGHWISEALEPVEIEESTEIESIGWGGLQLDSDALAGLRGMDFAFGLSPSADQPSSHAVN